MNNTFKISCHELLKLHRRAFKAQQRAHLEVCGLLSVDDSLDIKLVYLENLSDKPYSYEFDFKKMHEYEQKLANVNRDFIGSFHSHPVSEALPSSGDVKNAFYNGIELIHDVCGREARLWRLDGIGVTELELRVYRD